MRTSVSSGVTGVFWPLDEYVRQVGCWRKEEGGWGCEKGCERAEGDVNTHCKSALLARNTFEVIIINSPLELML
jgi:hypothetical protein